MAAIDYSPIANIKPFNLAESMGAGQALATGQYRLQDMQEQQNARAGLRTAVQAGTPQAMEDFSKQYPEQAAEWSAKSNQFKKNALDYKMSQLDLLGRLASGVKDQPTYERALAVAKENDLNVSNAPAQYDPNWVAQTQNQILSAKDKVSMAHEAWQRQHGEATSEETKRHNRAVEETAKRKVDIETAFLGKGASNPEVKDMIEEAAHRYVVDGSLPPNLGRGAQGAALTASILSRAAQINKENGTRPDQARLDQIANRASSSALNQLTKQEAMVGAFERNFNRNADLLLQQSDKTDRTGTPLVNRWIMAGKKSIEGDPDVSKLDLAVKSVVNEYTKIISGSMGNSAMAEGEIKKVNDLLNSAQTPEQIKEIVGFMKKETANRMKGFKEQRDSINADMKRGNSEAPKSETPTTGVKFLGFEK